jgi:hypothetical protein
MNTQNWANACVAVYQGALCKKYNLNTIASFAQEFKNYLTSDTFRKDLQNGQWGGSITVPIYGVPVTLGAQHTESQYNEFRQKITDLTTESINWQFLQTISVSVPDPQMAKEFNDCLRIRADGELFWYEAEEADDYVLLTITWKQAHKNDDMPIIKSVILENCQLTQGELSEGDEVEERVIIKLARNPNKDLLFMLATDRGELLYKKAAKVAPPVLTTLLVEFTPSIGLHGGPPDYCQNVTRSSIVAQCVVEGRPPENSEPTGFVIFECGYDAIVDSTPGSNKPTTWNGSPRALQLPVDSSVTAISIELTFDMGNSASFHEKRTSKFFLRQPGAGATGFQVYSGATNLGSVAIGGGCETNISQTFIDTVRGWTAVVATKFSLLPRGG